MIKKLLYSLIFFTLVLGASKKGFAQCPSAATPNTFSSTDITCFGANNGTITVDVTLTGTLTFALLDVSGTPFILPNTPVTTVTGTGTIAMFDNLPSSSYTIRVRKVGCPIANQLFIGGLGIDIYEPVFPEAGADQNSICNSTSATMAGNDPAPGLGVPASTGLWSLVSGPNTPTITDNTDPLTTITGLIPGTYVFDWTFSKAGCSDNVDQVTLVINSNPTTSDAGPNQAVCVNNATLAGNNPTVGTGTWTLLSGTGTITNSALRNTTVTALGTGANVFRWTISNPPCTDSFDDVTITFNTPPTVADAGPNQNICATTATLAGNNPTVGTGTWTVIAGGGAVTTPSSNTSGVTGLAIGNNIFRWTISNGGPCPNSTDDVTIFRATTPTVANAGADQAVCTTTATLAGNVAVVGTGTWTRISGSGTITSVNSPTSIITGLALGTSVFRWTIANAPCTSTSDDISITRNPSPTSVAGADQSICTSSTTLNATNPAIGTGNWTLISGTGTITNPALRNTSVTAINVGVSVFRWTVSNGLCPDATDDVTITRNNPPTASNAGPDQSVCSTTATLAGNIPLVGSGTWTRISGAGTITTPTSVNSGITGLGIGNNVFRWTISVPGCTSTIDEVTITRSLSPSAAVAGSDQTICGTTTTLAASAPIIGTGVWSVVSGTATVTTPSLRTSGVTGIAGASVVFRWTVSNGACTPTSDDMTLTVTPSPSPANAGTDQTICSTTTTLAATAPAIGTGVWSVVSGTATVTTPSLRTSGVTGITGPSVVFRWTVSNGTCTPTTDDMTLTVSPPPTTANAGADFSICGTTATLAGNVPATGVGTWSVVSGTATITSPNSATSGVTAIAGASVVFRWSIGNGSCPISTDDVTITITSAPTTANAGIDQTVCATTATLAGNAPVVGTGTWTRISGTATITTPSSPTSGVTGLSVGNNVFRWTIANAPCTASTDDVTIIRTATPTTANAGTDFSICGTTATLAGNVPATGVGTWSVVSGTATITSPNSATSGVTTIAGASVVFRWSIGNGSCPISTDDVTVTITSAPTTANAGIDQTVCATTATLAGNAPVVGTGTWTRISGTATITTPSSPTSGVTGLSVGNNVFRWTIANAPCTASTDDVTIIRTATPTTANAGADFSICGTTATLAGNVPATGVGTWSVVSGAATFANSNLGTTTVSALGNGDNVLRWTIGNGSCASSASDVTITSNPTPTTANAGSDFNICGTTATLAGNTAVIGTGTWSIVSGTGTITSPNFETSTVTGISGSSLVLSWTISNGLCPDSGDQITITIDSPPTTSLAGTNQTVCGTTATLDGNIPATGIGTWSVVSGAATFANSNLGTTTVSALGNGDNVLRWTIGNGSCAISASDVTITSNPTPTTANAGSDFNICGTSATLAGNTAIVGTGTWSIVSGTGTITSPNSNTSTVTGISGSSLVLSWTISNGLCPDSGDQITITIDSPPTTSLAGTNQTVCGTTATLDGNIPATGIGTWSVVSGAATFANSNLGTTTVSALNNGDNVLRWTIGNGSCASSTSEVTISSNGPTTADAGVNQTICESVGSVTLAGNNPAIGTGTWSIVSGIGTITSPNSNTSTVTGITGTSIVLQWSISDGGICPASTDDVTITIDETPTTSVAGTNQSICGTTTTLNGNIPVTGIGTWSVVSGAATFANSNLGTTTISSLNAGDNILRWTLGNGACPSSDSDVTITNNSPSTANAGIDFNICGTTATLAGNTAVIGTGTWSIVSGTATITSPNSNTSTVTGISGSSLVLSWTISNGLCPDTSDDITIFIDTPPSVSMAGANQIICGSVTTLTGNIPVTGIGTWSVVSGAATFANSNLGTTAVSALNTGDNILRWTIGNGSCASSASDVTITINPAILASITTTTNPSPCGSSTGGAFVTASGGDGNFTYVWNSVPLQTDASLTGVVAGIYNVIITDGNLCTFTATASITDAGAPTVTLTSDDVDNIICENSTIIFTPSGADNYSYFMDGNPIGTANTTLALQIDTMTVNHSISVTGITTLTGCTGISSAINIIVLPSPLSSVTISALPGTTVCSTQPVTFTTLVTNGGPSPTFQWQINGVDMGTSPTFNNILNGDVITCVMTTNSCATPVVPSNALTMTITPSITAEVVVTTIPSNVVCENTNVTFVATPNVTLSALTYKWYLKNTIGTTEVGTNSTFTSNTLANNDEVFCMISSTDPCVSNIPATSQIVTMTVNAGTPISATITATTNSICSGQTVDFTSTINPVGVVTYAWKIDGATVVGANANTFSSTSLTNNNIVSLEITYLSCGLVTTSTSNLVPISVSDPAKPTVNLSKKNRLCFGDTLTLSTNFTTGNVWSTGASTQSIVVGASGSYNVTVTDSKGCSAKSDDVVISVGDVLSLTLTSPTFEGGYNTSKHNSTDGSIDLTVTGGFTPYRYYWSTLAITEDITDVVANNYHVVVVDEINCVDTAYITLTNPPALELPTVFTPNGDGQNDFFTIRGVEVYPGTEVAIYNRWGNVVYNNKDYKNEWDGAAKSSGKVPDGTYFVVAIAKETDGTEIILKGYVELRTDLR